MLIPEDIEGKQFGVVMRGYSQKEVDDFLDEVVVSYREIHAELDGYRRADTAVLHPIVDVPAEVSQASRLLKVAEEACRQEQEEAKATARNIIDGAQTEAKNIVNAAHGERHRVIGELEEQRQKLQAKVDELENHRARVAERLAAALKEVE